MTMTSSLSKHGETSKMVTREFGKLTEADLRWLEEIVGAEFAKAKLEEKDASSILRIYNALRSQRNLLTMPKW